MKKTIYISEDLVKTIVRPTSMFINDIAVATLLTHISYDGIEEYGIEEDKFPKFSYASSAGGIHTFTIFDLKRFKFNGKSFKDYFQPISGKKAVITLDFKVLGCAPDFLKDGVTKTYPPFCYKGDDEFFKKKQVITDANNELKALNKPTARIPESLYEELWSSGIKEGFEDKYYRTLDLDAPFCTFQ